MQAIALERRTLFKAFQQHLHRALGSDAAGVPLTGGQAAGENFTTPTVWPDRESGVPSTVVSLAMSRRIPSMRSEWCIHLSGSGPGERHTAGDVVLARDHGA